MSSRSIRGPFRYSTWKKVTANYTVVNESLILVDTTGGVVTITLPASVTVDGRREVMVRDVGGQAATNNITVQRAGSDTINGGASQTISTNYGGAAFFDCSGGVWTASGVAAINGAFANLTLTGAFTDSSASAVSAAGTTQATATALTVDDNYVSTVGANAGVALPAATAGRTVAVVNAGANALKIYPINGGTDAIGGLGANNPTLLPVGQLAFFTCVLAGTWNTLLITPRQVQTTISTVGAGTLTAAGIVGGFLLRGGSQSAAPFSDATDTAAAIIAALHGATVGQSWSLTIQNNTNAAETLTNGAGVTVSGVTVIPPNMWAEYLVTYSAAGAVTMVGVGMGANAQLAPTQYTSISSGNGTLTGAQVAGARHVTLLTSGATAQTTPTAANILAAMPNGQVGDSYVLRIVNTNGGTLTITADATVTATGTLTLATNTWREWYITITGAATATMKQIGVGTTS